MPTHDHDPLNPEEGHPREEIDVSKGYEASDVKVSGIVVFIVSLSILVVVAAVLSYGIGYAIFAYLGKEDVQDYGKRTKWTKTVDVRTLGDRPRIRHCKTRLHRPRNSSLSLGCKQTMGARRSPTCMRRKTCC